MRIEIGLVHTSSSNFLFGRWGIIFHKYEHFLNFCITGSLILYYEFGVGV